MDFVDDPEKLNMLISAGKDFELDGEKHWFVVAEDGSCALFDKEYNIDDLSKVKEITDEMIREDITSIIIPDSVDRIGYKAFSWCESLKSINIPNSVKSIREYAFAGCKSLISINIPDLVESIGNDAFYNCKSLISINIPDSVKSIGEEAFFWCESLKEVIFKGKTLDDVKSMKKYPWGIEDESIIKAEL